MTRRDLELRAAAWRRHAAVKSGLWCAAAAALGAAPWVGLAPVWRGAGALAAIAVAAFFLRRSWSRVDEGAVAAHLNREVSELEESAGLWLRDPAALTLVERLQLRRLDAAWRARADRARLGYPQVRRLRVPAAAAVAALALLLAGLRTPAPMVPAGGGPATVLPAPPGPPVAPTLRRGELSIVPPSYLGQPARVVAGLDAEVPEGSRIDWLLEIEGDAAAVRLVGPGGEDSVLLERRGRGYAGTARLEETRIYHVAVTRGDGSETALPGLHAIKVVRDAAPRVAWVEPAASRTTVAPGGGPVRIVLAATDDHAVGDAKLVATVAKGTGEGVKFRERELPLPRAAAAGTRSEFGLGLDLAALGLEPGDELYFHALVSDRREPRPNTARSETRTLVLQGPATVPASAGAPVAGVNLVPQYFRSQRQLIMDTEKLLAERPQLAPERFRARSEDIGLDQKLLRLRYGQFLGEEFEPVALGAPPEARGAAFAARIRSPDREGQRRDAAVERAIEAQHNHAPAPDREGRPPTAEEIAAPFVHRHDAPESETLYEDKVKAALRAVLAAMWEAEGHLRAGRPDAALPAENRALELLKALQQADRIIVKRVGFETAPVDVDARRLRGELDGIPARANADAPVRLPAAGEPEVRAALAAADWRALAPELQAAVGARLERATREDPERFLAALAAWREPGGGVSADATVRRALVRLLPAAAPVPVRSADADPERTARYFRALGDSREEAPR